MRKRKPDILLVLAVLIGLGVIATEVVQAFSDGRESSVVASASR